MKHKQTLQRGLSVLLALVMCLTLLPVTAFANTIPTGLTFTAEMESENNPSQGWAWDKETRTLTLKDGFSLECSSGDGIHLPAGSTVVVEGTAVIVASDDEDEYKGNGIAADGNLTIQGNDAGTSNLTINAAHKGVCVYLPEGEDGGDIDMGQLSVLTLDSEPYGIDDVGNIKIVNSTLTITACWYGVYADDGSVTVTGSTLDITTEEWDGIYADQDITIEKNSKLTINAEGEGVYSDYGDIEIDQSTLTINAGWYGVDADDGSVTITGSTLNITTEEDDGIWAGDDIAVTGGKLIIKADENALDADKITLSNLAFDLQTMDYEDYSLFDMDDAGGFSLPGTFRLYDAEEKELYMGKWDPERLEIDGGALYVGDEEVFHAVSEDMDDGEFPIGWLGGLLLPLDSMVSYPFVDVPPMYYFFDAVNWAVENGITTGTGRLTFSPNAACTRAQAVTFLWRAAGCPAPKSAVMPFTDVAEGSYYYDAVLWAVENGITKGTSDTTFSPNATCTRAQIVTFLCRAFGEASGAATPFADVAADAYYAGAVSWAAANGVTGGTSDTTFCPDAPCTRAQIVTFLYRCLS